MKDYIRLIKMVIPHKTVLILASITMMLSSAFNGISIGMIIPVVDNIIRGKKIVVTSSIKVIPVLQRLIDTANNMSSVKLMNTIVAIILVAWLLRNFFEFWRSYYMNDLSQLVIRDVKNALYSKLLTLPLDYYSKNPTGRLVSRITHDAGIIRDSISTGLMDCLYQPIQMVVYMAIVLVVKVYFSISWSLIFVSLGLFSLVVYPVIVIGKKLKKISRTSQEQMAIINNTLYETISGIRVVKAFTTEDRESAKVTDQNQRFYKLAMKSVKRMTIVSPITEFVGILCIAVVLWIVGKQILTEQLSAGAFIAFLTALLSMMKPIKRLTNLYGINQQALAAATRIYEVLDTVPSFAEKKDARTLPKITRSIEFRGVSFRYEDKDILKDITIQVAVGEIAAFVGPSGVGKTSLVNLIPRFYDVAKGAVLIDGVDVRDVTLKSLRSQIGIVTQETILFNDTVANNIAYGADRFVMDDIIRAARIANAHTFIAELPQGYDTVVGERGFRLSGGEKQRIAIARAVFRDPPILILDEATSQLDTESEIIVQEAIDKLMRGRTVFAIAHRLSTIKHADKIFVLDQGRIVEVGNHQALIERGGLYTRLYNVQFRENVLQ